MKTIKMHQVQEPFTIVESKEKFFVCIGNHVVSSKTFDKLQQAKMYINQKPYELIINATCLVFELNSKMKRTKAIKDKVTKLTDNFKVKDENK